jgi:hypothetical protein
VGETVKLPGQQIIVVNVVRVDESRKRSVEMKKRAGLKIQERAIFSPSCHTTDCD